MRLDVPGTAGIDFAVVLQRQENLSARDAIYRAALLRFRPIMMTTMGAILGALPLAIGLGAGSITGWMHNLQKKLEDL